MTTDPMGELRQADRVLRNAVNAFWQAASAALAAAKTETAGEPFDPALPGHLDAFIAAWQSDIGTDETLPVGEAMATDGQWLILTFGELVQFRDRLAYAEKTRLELAEKCAAWRGQRDEAQQKLDAVRAIEIHGGEFVDAVELYRALEEPMPDRPDIDHAANIRTRAAAASNEDRA